MISLFRSHAFPSACRPSRALSTTVRVLSLPLTTLMRGHYRELHPRHPHSHRSHCQRQAAPPRPLSLRRQSGRDLCTSCADPSTTQELRHDAAGQSLPRYGGCVSYLPSIYRASLARLGFPTAVPSVRVKTATYVLKGEHVPSFSQNRAYLPHEQSCRPCAPTCVIG